MKILINKFFILYSSLLIVLFLFGCSSYEDISYKNIKIESSTLSCCPDGGGILDSNVNLDLRKELLQWNWDNETNEYASFVSAGNPFDTLWFTSSRDYSSPQITNRRKKDSRLPAEILYSTRPNTLRNTCPNSGWSQPERLQTNIIRFDELTRGCPIISNGKLIVAAEKNLNQEKTEFNPYGTSFNLDLWQLSPDGTGKYIVDTKQCFDLVNVKNNDNNSANFWTSQPTISPCGNHLFFVSNRPYDKVSTKTIDLNIWYSYKDENGNWQAPIPVETINSKANDITPFFGSDSTFYFASNKRNDFDTTYKDYDIYSCKIKWENNKPIPIEPININDSYSGANCKGNHKFNINTTADELFPFISPELRAIYYTSNKNGGYGKLDIYACSLPEICIKLMVSVRKISIDTIHGKNKIDTSFVQKKLSIHAEDGSHSLASFNSDTEIELKANKIYNGYDIEIDKSAFCEECNKVENKIINTKNIFLNTTIYDTVEYQCYKKPSNNIVFDNIKVPFFITGYWKPTTIDNFKEINERWRNKSIDTSFIEFDSAYYYPIAKSIDDFFENQVYSQLRKRINEFDVCGTDSSIIKITIHGFTDPRRLRPGKYSADPSANINDIVIPEGWNMKEPYLKNSAGQKVTLKDAGQNGNIALSMLRAYFTGVTIDSKMQNDNKYKELISNNKIKYNYQGFGIYDSTCYPDNIIIAGENISKTALTDENKDFPTHRNIVIYFDFVNPNDYDAFDRGPCGDTCKSYLNYLKKKNKIEKQIQKKDSIELKESKITSELRKLPILKEPVGGCAGPSCFVVVYGEVKNKDDYEKLIPILEKFGFYNSQIIKHGKRLRIISKSFDKREEAEENRINFIKVFQSLNVLFEDAKYLKAEKVDIYEVGNQAIEEEE